MKHIPRRETHLAGLLTRSFWDWPHRDHHRHHRLFTPLQRQVEMVHYWQSDTFWSGPSVAFCASQKSQCYHRIAHRKRSLVRLSSSCQLSCVGNLLMVRLTSTAKLTFFWLVAGVPLCTRSWRSCTWLQRFLFQVACSIAHTPSKTVEENRYYMLAWPSILWLWHLGQFTRK